MISNKPTEIPITYNTHRDVSIHIGENSLSGIGGLLEQAGIGKTIVVISQRTLSAYTEPLIKELESTYTVKLLEVPEGESFKSFEMAGKLLDSLVNFQLERSDTVIAVGGGVIGDLGGFVASIYKRGINLIQVPTSLLAQVDAAIGGKTGVNHKLGKNLIGAFYQPLYTIIDPLTLTTLPQRELLCGLAEIIKYGVIRDPDLFKYIEDNISNIKAFSVVDHPEIWSHLILRSAQNKVDVVSEDQLEKGVRATLNFGHTIGHAIEAAFDYKTFRHGEAVALGMKAAGYLSVSQKKMHQKDYQRLLNLLEACGFTLTIPPIDPQHLLRIISTDKKVHLGKIRFVLATGIGGTEMVDDVDEPAILDAIGQLFSPEDIERHRET